MKYRLQRKVDELRRQADETLLVLVKVAKIYREEGKEAEATQCEKAAEFIQGLDNDLFMASIALS